MRYDKNVEWLRTETKCLESESAWVLHDLYFDDESAAESYSLYTCYRDGTVKINDYETGPYDLPYWLVLA